jgi:two-component system response regulator (stage 0 sporulation protein A)
MDNSSIRIGLADDNQEFCRIVREFLSRYSDLQVVAIANDGLSAVDMVKDKGIDVLLLDMIMPKLDGIGVLERIRELRTKPRIIIFSAFGHEEMTRKAVELGADYFIVKPFDLQVLAQRIRDVAKNGSFLGDLTYTESTGFEVERDVSRILQRLRIPPHFKGYTYLREAIIRCVSEPTLVNEVTKKLYPQIAEKFGTTRHRVERSMRFAIETACERGELDYLYSIMGYTVDEKKGKPTNASFIAKIADQIRLEKKVRY